MSKPITVPNWAATGVITEPSSAKKNAGWVAGERPPAQFLNWWQFLVGIWFTFLDGIFASDGSITVPNGHFTGTLTVDGEIINGATHTMCIPIAAAVATGTHVLHAQTGDVPHWTLGAANADRVTFPVRVEKNWKIIRWRYYADCQATATVPIGRLFKVHGLTTTPAEVSVDAADVKPATAGAGIEVAQSAVLTESVEDRANYYVAIVSGGTTGGSDLIYGVEVDYTII